MTLAGRLQVDKVTGRFNGQFKTYAICGAIRRMVSPGGWLTAAPSWRGHRLRGGEDPPHRRDGSG